MILWLIQVDQNDVLLAHVPRQVRVEAYPGPSVADFDRIRSTEGARRYVEAVLPQSISRLLWHIYEKDERLGMLERLCQVRGGFGDLIRHGSSNSVGWAT